MPRENEMSDHETQNTRKIETVNTNNHGEQSDDYCEWDSKAEIYNVVNQVYIKMGGGEGSGIAGQRPRVSRNHYVGCSVHGSLYSDPRVLL